MLKKADLTERLNMYDLYLEINAKVKLFLRIQEVVVITLLFYLEI